jgi:hypothetical protein
LNSNGTAFNIYSQQGNFLNLQVFLFLQRIFGLPTTESDKAQATRPFIQTLFSLIDSDYDSSREQFFVKTLVQGKVGCALQTIA